MINEEEQGLGCNYGEADFDWMADWWRPRRGDRRLRTAMSSTPRISGGRRMTHPYRSDIVYPRIPDTTTNFDIDVIRGASAVVTKTLDGSAVSDFIEFDDDVLIREIWRAESLSTLTELFREFHRFRTDVIPEGQYIGWQPRDRTWKRFYIQLLKVECGEGDEYVIEQLGRSRPFLMRFALAVTFKLVRDVSSPSGVLVASGA